MAETTQAEYDAMCERQSATARRGLDERERRAALLRLPGDERQAVIYAARVRATARLKSRYADEYRALVQDEMARMSERLP